MTNTHYASLRYSTYVPKARQNLISIAWIDSMGGRVIYNHGQMSLHNLHDKPLTIVTLKMGYITSINKPCPKMRPMLW